MRNGCFAQHTYCRTLPPTIWVTRCTPECFLTLFCSHFPTSLSLPFSHPYFPDTGHISSPTLYTYSNLCFLFWCRAFYHYFPLGIIAAGAMNRRHASTAGGISRWWMRNCINLAIFEVADVITICGCSAAPDRLTVAVFARAAPPLLCSPTSPFPPSRPISSVMHSAARGQPLSSLLDFQKADLCFFSPLLSLLSSTTQIHSTANLRPPTALDSPLAMCENVSMSLTGCRRFLPGHRLGMEGPPMVTLFQIIGGKSR